MFERAHVVSVLEEVRIAAYYVRSKNDTGSSPSRTGLVKQCLTACLDCPASRPSRNIHTHEVQSLSVASQIFASRKERVDSTVIHAIRITNVEQVPTYLSNLLAA